MAKKDFTKLKTWLEIMPKEWHGIAEEKWERGYRFFKKIAVRPSHVEEATGDLEEGSAEGDAIILEFPAVPPDGCVYQLAWSIDGSSWGYCIPGPSGASNVAAILKKMAGRHREMIESYQDSGRDLIEKDLPQWLLFGDEEESRIAQEIDSFLRESEGVDGFSDEQAGMFWAGFRFYEMMIRHRKIAAAKDVQPESGLRAIARKGISLYGDCGAKDMLRQMGGGPSRNQNVWIFPNGQKIDQIAFAKALSNERNGN